MDVWYFWLPYIHEGNQSWLPEAVSSSIHIILNPSVWHLEAHKPWRVKGEIHYSLGWSIWVLSALEWKWPQYIAKLVMRVKDVCGVYRVCGCYFPEGYLEEHGLGCAGDTTSVAVCGGVQPGNTLNAPWKIPQCSLSHTKANTTIPAQHPLTQPSLCRHSVWVPLYPLSL